MLVPPLKVAFYPSFSLSPERLCTQESLNDGNFPGGPVFKNPPCNATDAGSIPDRGTKISHASGKLNTHSYYTGPGWSPCVITRGFSHNKKTPRDAAKISHAATKS